MLICLLEVAVQVSAQTTPSCDLVADSKNSSRLCVQFAIRDGRLAIDRQHSLFKPSSLFTQRLSIPLTEAQTTIFTELEKLLATIPRPYRFALSDQDKALDDQGKLNDEATNRIRNATMPWSEYIQRFEEWSSATGKERGVGDIFPESEATASDGLLFPLATSQERNALLIYEDAGYEAEEGLIRFAVADPINNWTDPEQVQLRLPGVTDNAKKQERLRRLTEILQPLSGRPRCLECITLRLNSFYRRLGLTPNLIFDNKGTSPLIINVVEAARIVGISWVSLKDDDDNIDKVLYSLLTDQAFRAYLKQRDEIRVKKQFNYIQQTGTSGPYLNPTRMQIQQLLVNQLGYSVSVSFAPNTDEPLASNFNLTIQKNSEEEQLPATNNETPESAPATANPEGIVTAHEQEKDAKTEFGSTEEPDRPKDKKRYVGGGIEYYPGQGARFFGLGQVSRFPFLSDSINSLSAKGGGQGTTWPIGSANFFSDYLFFNTLHRRVSVQLTISSDLDPNRNLGGPRVDERQKLGLGRVEFEPFRNWSGSLLRFYAEGRHETVSFDSASLTVAKTNLTTLDLGALYLFESTEVENPRRIRVQPLLRMGLGLAVDEPRYNKVVVTANFHQVLPSRFEYDVSGRVERASRATPRFELPSFGGADVVRGFRRDDGLGRSLWSLQNELWIPLPIADETSQGLKAMIREKVKLAPFFDVGGLYETITTTPGVRTGAGIGVRFIYSPIVFKIDYGYGFGTAANGGSHGKFYFSLGSNLPF
jgi:hypothetical protein